MVSLSPNALVSPCPPAFLGPNTKAPCSPSGQSLSSRSLALCSLTHSPGPSAFWSLPASPFLSVPLDQLNPFLSLQACSRDPSHVYLSPDCLPQAASSSFYQIPKPGTHFKFHIRFTHSLLAIQRPTPSALPASLKEACLTPSPLGISVLVPWPLLPPPVLPPSLLTC